MADKTVICVHNEVIVDHIGTCSLCGQTREYDPYERLLPKVIKRGRIDGVLTDVSPVMNQRRVQEEVPSPPGEQAIQTLKPSNWDKMKKGEKTQWLEEHREEILKDIGELGEFKTRERWGIYSPTWLGLKRRWSFGVIRKGAYVSQEGILRRQAYFEKNKEAILADYHSLRLKDFYKKWGLSSNTWIKLKELWKVPHKFHQDRRTRLQQEFTLPEFPAFNDKWGDSVQVKWLEVYPELYREANAKGTRDKKR